MRKPFIAGNWKMNTSREEATGLATAVKAVPARGVLPLHAHATARAGGDAHDRRVVVNAGHGFPRKEGNDAGRG